MQKFHSHGKLLITGEYVVLDGATALALPTRFGQSLEVKEIQAPLVKWKSIDAKGEIWFEDEFQISEILSQKPQINREDNEVSKMLYLALHSAAAMNSEALKEGEGFEVTSKVDFPRSWGLGTSSTLITNLAKWFENDPYQLLEKTFGGSGYDIAVGMHGTPITFEKQGLENSILRASFDPPFKNQLFFIHLNRKQNSREAIEHYRQQDKTSLKTTSEKISALTHRMISCTDLLEFNLLIEVHENLISRLLDMQKVKSRLFPDFAGAVKSLGGWGGDFVLATGTSQDMDYFRSKGYDTILAFDEMILD